MGSNYDWLLDPERGSRIELFSKLLDRCPPARPVDSSAPRVTHCIGSLAPGGAERQVCNFASGAAQLGITIDVLLAAEPVGVFGHYAPLLRKAGIRPRTLGRELSAEFVHWASAHLFEAMSLRSLPGILMQPYTVELMAELIRNPPDVLHGWLDQSNLWCGVAGLMAGVPIIVLSTRNLNPNHFPHLANPDYEFWYRLLATHDRVHFVNNSRAGADDYAQWLDVAPGRFQVVLNGVDFSNLRSATDVETRALRAELGVPQQARVVSSVVRFHEEKDPLAMVEVARRVMMARSDVHTVIVGAGPWEDRIRSAISESGVTSRFHMSAHRDDLATLLTLSSAVLLTSRVEGTPNILLEAQALGCPVVSTRAGGAVDAVDHERTGFLADVGDVESLTRFLGTVLDDEGLRGRLAGAAPGFVRQRFGQERMVDETLAVYAQALLDLNECTSMPAAWGAALARTRGRPAALGAPVPAT